LLHRSSNELLKDISCYTSPTKRVPERKPKTALFKKAPDRLSQLQKLLKAEVKYTAIQTVPMVTSFMINRSPSSTGSSTPLASDDEVCFNVAQKKEQRKVTFANQLGQDDSPIHQSLQPGTPPTSLGFPQPRSEEPALISQPPVQGFPYSLSPPSLQQPKQGIPPTPQSPPGPPASQSFQGFLTSQLLQGFPPMNQSLQGLLTSKTPQGYPPASQGFPSVSQPSQGFPSVSQPLQGFPSVSQPSQGFPSVNQKSQGFSPMSQQSHGNSPFNLFPSFATHSGSTPFSTLTPAGLSGQPFLLHNTAPPPPPPFQENRGTSPTTTSTAKTPAEMAAEAALKRQDSTTVATTTSQTAVTTMSEAAKAPVVVITASEMPPSSLFFTVKSQRDKSVTQSSAVMSDANRFAAPNRSNSLPANAKFPFSAQTGMTLPFSVGNTPLAFSLTTNKMAAASSPLANTGTSLTSTSKPASHQQPSSVVTTSLPSLQTTTSSAGNVTKPSTEAEEATEESDQSDNEHDVTLTDTTNAHTTITSLLTTSAAATTMALPILSKPTMSVVSTESFENTPTAASVAAPPPGSMPTLLALSTGATPLLSAATLVTSNTSSTFTPSTSATLQSSAPPTIQSSAPPTLQSSAPPTLQTSAPPTATEATTAPSAVPSSSTAGSISLTAPSSSGADGESQSATLSLLKVPPSDKSIDSDEESDLCDNVIDKVSSQSPIMTDDINVVDDASEGEMEPNGLSSSVKPMEIFIGACLCGLLVPNRTCTTFLSICRKHY